MTVPWVKRIDRRDHSARALALDADTPLATSHRVRGGVQYDDRFECVDGSWFHVSHRWPAAPEYGDDELEKADPEPEEPDVIIDRVWATHGTVARGHDAFFVFMEHLEARHPQLEAALASDPSALGVYADWLEEQGDPYAAALKPELLKARGLAGLWFLEGLDRTGRIQFTLREGLVREANLGAVMGGDLMDALSQLCHLRASVALEHVSLVPSTNAPRGALLLDAQHTAGLAQLPWPAALKRLTLGRGDLKASGAILKAQLSGVLVKMG